MSAYNINTIMYLLNTFTRIVTVCGKDSNSVRIYKDDVAKLVKAGRVSANDESMVEKIIGMENTDAVKWEKASEKVEIFKREINRVDFLNKDQDIKVMVNKEVERDKLTENLARLILDIYDEPARPAVSDKPKVDYTNFINNSMMRKKEGAKPSLYESRKVRLVQLDSKIKTVNLRRKDSSKVDFYVRIENVNRRSEREPKYYYVNVINKGGITDEMKELILYGAKVSIGYFNPMSQNKEFVEKLFV